MNLTRAATHTLRRCEVNVDVYSSNQKTDVASWFDIWTAGIAVNELCIRKGMLGTARTGRSFPKNRFV